MRLGNQTGNFCAVGHDCSQCGAVVENGQPFCPKCHAPQIKVPVRPPTAPVTEPLPPGTPEDLQPPAEPVVDETNGLVTQESIPPQPENKLIWRAALGSALVAGLLAAVGTSIPIIPLAMLCMFASGGLAVTLYRRRAGYHTVTPWMGAKLGLLAGGLGFGLLALLSTFRLFAASERTRIALRLPRQIARGYGGYPRSRRATSNGTVSRLHCHRPWADHHGSDFPGGCGDLFPDLQRTGRSARCGAVWTGERPQGAMMRRGEPLPCAC